MLVFVSHVWYSAMIHTDNPWAFLLAAVLLSVCDRMVSVMDMSYMYTVHKL